jgi:bacterioferritin
MQGSVMPGAAAYPRFEDPATTPPDSRVLGYLGRALSLEFSAGQHYLAQASLAKFRNEIAYAEGFVELANEEFQHANMLTDRMVALGAVPAGSILTPAVPTNNIVEALRACEAREIALVQLYGEAAQHSLTIGATDDHALFARLMSEEQAQLVKINEWVQGYYHSLTVPNGTGQTHAPRSFV